jgi:hypothetical protein
LLRGKGCRRCVGEGPEAGDVGGPFNSELAAGSVGKETDDVGGPFNSELAARSVGKETSDDALVGVDASAQGGDRGARGCNQGGVGDCQTRM